MKSYPAKFKSFQQTIVQMGALKKLQNSIQTLIILWLVYPVHLNSLFKALFEELPFCHFPLISTSILGKDSKFHFNILVFQTNGKQPYSFSVLSCFCNGRLLNSFGTLSGADPGEVKWVNFHHPPSPLPFSEPPSFVPFFFFSYHLNQALVLLHYYKNSPPISKSWIRG